MTTHRRAQQGARHDVDQCDHYEAAWPPAKVADQGRQAPPLPTYMHAHLIGKHLCVVSYDPERNRTTLLKDLGDVPCQVREDTLADIANLVEANGYRQAGPWRGYNFGWTLPVTTILKP